MSSCKRRPFTSSSTLSGKLRGGHGTRTFRVFEHESRVEHHLFHQGEGLLVIFLAFIVEPDEHVRGNSTIGERSPGWHESGQDTIHGYIFGSCLSVRNYSRIGRVDGCVCKYWNGWLSHVECHHSYLLGVTWRNGYACWVPFGQPWQAEPGNSLPDYLPARDMNLHSDRVVSLLCNLWIEGLELH